MWRTKFLFVFQTYFLGNSLAVQWLRFRAFTAGGPCSMLALLAFRVSAEKSVNNLMGIPLHIICCFSLVTFTML